MVKHAYLILAHKNIRKQLFTLLNLLDDEKHDLYIHIDKKCKSNEINILKKKINQISLLSKVEIYTKYKVAWGGSSIIKTELFLLKQASKKNYEYYHLLSGLDLPLKSNNDIYAFFHERHPKEFIHFSNKQSDELNERFQYYYRFQNAIGNTSGIIKKILIHFQNASINHQKKMGKTRKCPYSQIAYGAQWFSITDDFAHCLVSKAAEINKSFSRTYCCDEVFVQTILSNSPFLKNIYWEKHDDDYRSISRYVDWKRGFPYTFQKGDFDELVNSDYMFARKFDIDVDETIVDRITKTLTNDSRK